MKNSKKTLLKVDMSDNVNIQKIISETYKKGQNYYKKIEKNNKN